MLCRRPGSGGPGRQVPRRDHRGRLVRRHGPHPGEALLGHRLGSHTASMPCRCQDGPDRAVRDQSLTERRDGDDLVLGQRAEPLDAAGQLDSAALVATHGHRPLHALSTEDAGPALPADEAYGVEAVLLEVAAQRDLGVLHVHGVRRAAAQPGQVDPAVLVQPRDLGWPCRGPSGRSRAPRAAPPCWPRTGRRPCGRSPRSRRGARR